MNRTISIAFGTVVGVEVFEYWFHRLLPVLIKPSLPHVDVAALQMSEEPHISSSVTEEIQEADRHFIWLMLAMITGEIIIGYLVSWNIYPQELTVVTVAGVMAFYVNWWIHSSFHQDNHWLNRYDWFVKEKNHHLTHHQEPNKNFGIISHFNDQWYGTWKE